MKPAIATLLLAVSMTMHAGDNITNKPTKLLLDTTAILTNAKDVWAGYQKGSDNLPQAFTGKGVVAGVIDMGLDPTHPMFRHEDGSSRIKWFWDVSKVTDENPLGVINKTPEKALNNGPAMFASNAPHGTHVAGIMAGSAFGGVKGIAYEADMMWAEYTEIYKDKSKEMLVAEFRQYFPDKPLLAERLRTLESDDLYFILAMKKIYDQADALGQPCVINMSYGSRALWQYTLRTAEEAIEDMLKTPGHILVAGLGNDGLQDVYREKEAGKPLSIELDGKDQNLWLKWKRTDEPPVLLLTEENSTTTITFDKLMKAIEGWTPGHDGSVVTDSISKSESERITLTYLDQMSDDDEIVVLMRSFFHNIKKIECETPGALKIMMPSHYFSLQETTGKGMSLHTASYPASLESVIGVGAMHYRNQVKNSSGEWITTKNLGSSQGKLASLSSCGPSFDGLTKPDVVAPGHNIISAYSSACKNKEMQKTKVYEEEKFGAKHGLAIFSGTSMATPCVSGIIALWLQANPKLTQKDVMEIIRKTSHQPDAAYTEKNNYYGWGMIDAYAGMLEALKLTSAVKDLSTHQPQQGTLRLEGRRLHVNMADSESAELRVYTTAGTLKATYKIEGTTTIDLSHLAAGVYALQLNTGNKATTGSSLIRL